jgi:hypothetical protein
MDSIEGVRRSAQADSFDVVHGHFTGLQGLMGSLPGKFFGGLLSAPHEFGHARADDSNFSHSHGMLLSVA